MDERTHEKKAQATPEIVIPDYYVNTVNFAASIYEFLVQFSLRTTPDKPPTPLANVRMSPQHAKVMARLFMKQVKAYEREVGPIYLPQKLIEDLQLEDTEKL